MTESVIHKKTAGRRKELDQIYAYPIPIVFSEPNQTRLNSVLGLLGISTTQVSNPHCEGYLDASTRSVWIVNSKDSLLLWRRGFFGKGNLSRSEPTWLSRQVNARKMGAKNVTAEEMTAKRRAERKQFKLDRARAIAAAAAEAEAAFAEGRVVENPTIIPSVATWKPNAQQGEAHVDPSESGVLGAEVDEETPQDLEHLQLTFQEAFFLLWNFDCLTILEPEKDEVMPLHRIWLVFQKLYISPEMAAQISLQLDNPFLIHYVVYHHFRSLGWVVRGGIKFCVDYLLYKRGPVFHHAEFAVVVCPVYEDPKDQESSIFNLENVSPFSWSWLSTINRVNSQVQKTIVLAYVTIPARSRVPVGVLSSPACLRHYSIREVILKRWIPARMRE